MYSLEPVLWSIKYQPTTWDEFIGQETAINQLRSLAESKTVPHLLLYGPSGTGKTLAAYAYARHVLESEFTSNFKWLNIRDLRSFTISAAKRKIQALAKLDRAARSELDEYMSVVYREAKAELKAKGMTGIPNRSQLLHQAVKMFASTAAVGSDMVKILVLDEADAFDNNMLQALRRTMEIYSDTCRFVLVTPSLAGWNPAIISRCITVHFKAATPEDITQLLSMVSEKESVDIDMHGLNAIIRESNGSMRRALNLLQMCAASGKTITEDIVYAFADTPLTSGVRSMISQALDNKYLKARKALRNLLTMEQYTPQEVIAQVQREIAKRPLEPHTVRHIIDRIAEIDYRMIQGKNPHIHLTALLASIANMVDTT